MVNDLSIPIDLAGLTSDQRALVMIHRRDCEIDMTGLTPYDRARVMASRPDCEIDLMGLSSYESSQRSVIVNTTGCNLADSSKPSPGPLREG